MSPGERTWLLGAAVAAAAAILVAALAQQRWVAAQRRLSTSGPQTMAMPPDEASLAEIQARLAAVRHRLPESGSVASRQLQQALLELVQSLGLEITEVVPRPGADFTRATLPGCPGWPGAVLELRGRAAFPAVAALLARLPSLDAMVLPLEVELTRGTPSQVRRVEADVDAPTSPPAPTDDRLLIRLVLAL